MITWKKMIEWMNFNDIFALYCMKIKIPHISQYLISTTKILTARCLTFYVKIANHNVLYHSSVTKWIPKNTMNELKLPIYRIPLSCQLNRSFWLFRFSCQILVFNRFWSLSSIKVSKAAGESVSIKAVSVHFHPPLKILINKITWMQRYFSPIVLTTKTYSPSM